MINLIGKEVMFSSYEIGYLNSINKHIILEKGVLSMIDFVMADTDDQGKQLLQTLSRYSLKLSSPLYNRLNNTINELKTTFDMVDGLQSTRFELTEAMEDIILDLNGNTSIFCNPHIKSLINLIHPLFCPDGFSDEGFEKHVEILRMVEQEFLYEVNRLEEVHNKSTLPPNQTILEAITTLKIASKVLKKAIETDTKIRKVKAQGVIF